MTKNIPILLYHELFPADGSNSKNYSMTGETFESHVKYLSENGFRSLTPDDLIGGGRIEKGGKGVIISFDDGYKSDYSTALPALKKFGMKAVFFVTAGWVGTAGFVTWEDLIEMRSLGMSIGSHGLTHRFLSDLDKNELRSELAESREALEKRLGARIGFLSLPGGFGSGRVLREAKAAGYRGVCTSIPGLNGARRGEEFSVFNRFVMTRKTSFEEFKAVVNGDAGTLAAYRAKHHLKNGIKKVLGSKNYYALWARFFRQA